MIVTNLVGWGNKSIHIWRGIVQRKPWNECFSTLKKVLIWPWSQRNEWSGLEFGDVTAMAVVALPFVRRVLKSNPWPQMACPYFFCCSSALPTNNDLQIPQATQFELWITYIVKFSPFFIEHTCTVVSIQGRSPIDSLSGLSGHVRIAHTLISHYRWEKCLYTRKNAQPVASSELTDLYRTMDNKINTIWMAACQIVTSIIIRSHTVVDIQFSPL